MFVDEQETFSNCYSLCTNFVRVWPIAHVCTVQYSDFLKSLGFDKVSAILGFDAAGLCARGRSLKLIHSFDAF
jgi:hypothetical protein